MKYKSIKNLFKVGNDGKYDFGNFSLKEFEYLQNNDWVCFEKIDGMNIRVIYEDGKIKFMGRTDKAVLPKGLVDKLHEIFDNKISWLEEHFPEGVILYGEGIGKGINGNRYRLDGYDFILFDVLYKDGDWKFADKVKAVSGIAKCLGIKFANVVEEYKYIHPEYVLGYEKKKSNINKDVDMEGVVCVPEFQLYDRNGDRIITKIKYKYF